MTDGLTTMRRLVRALPEQIERGWAAYGALDLPLPAGAIDRVVVAGMGGSAIGGDLIGALFADDLAVPVHTVRDYELPGWARDRCLLVASSFSGNTEETLSAYEQAGKRGLARVAVTSGGALAERAAAESVPVVRLPVEGPPRAALGASLTAVAGVLHATGLLADPGPALRAAAAGMQALVGEDDDAGDTADVAAVLAGRIPVVVAPARGEPIARRWKTQLNENAKLAAVWDTLPEMDHNGVVGLEWPRELERHLAFVFLTGPSTHPRVTQRIEVTGRILDDAMVAWTVVAAPSGPFPAEALWLVQFGDLLSLRLAEMVGADPMPIAAIDRLKAALGRLGAP